MSWGLIGKQCQRHDYIYIIKFQPNFSTTTKLKLYILTKPSIIIMTKIWLRNLNQTSAAKCWVKYSFKVSPKLKLLTPGQTLYCTSTKITKWKSIRQWVSNWAMNTKNEFEWYYWWGFKNELKQILPPTLSISDIQTSNKCITTKRISIWVICYCWGNSSMVEGRFSKWF